MKVKLIVGTNSYYGENKPDEEIIADIDFEGIYMIQVDLRDMTFTGRGMDGGGVPLNEDFYNTAKVEREANETT